MRVDRSLNLVIPCDTDNGVVYIHSTPISRQVFEQYHLPIAETFSTIYQKQLIAAGPRVAALLLQDKAKAEGLWDGPDGVERGLIPEIRRLTNVLMTEDSGGWTMVPFEDVKKRKLLSEDDVADIEGLVTFFIVNSAMHRKKTSEQVLTGIASLWEAEVTSLDCSEYLRSLQTSKETGSSGGTAPI